MTGKKFARVTKVLDERSYLLQDITVVQSVLLSFTEDIFSFRASRAFFRRETAGEIAIFKLLQNLVTGDGYKVHSLINDIDPSEAEK